MYIEYRAGEKHAQKGADTSETHESFRDCGYVLSEGDLVVDIDCLEKEIIKTLLIYFHIETQIVWTERGAHIYFKKPETFRGANCICPLGFAVEYKHSRNTESVTIKRNGVLRKIENEGIREELPFVFQYFKKYESLLGLQEGDGRNEKLYKHRLKMNQQKGWQNIIRFINNHVFAEPLEDGELEVLLRDLKIEVKKDNEYELATYIINKYKTVKYFGNVYFKTEGQYESNEDVFKQILFQEFPNVRTRVIDEILKQVEYRSKLYKGSHVFDIKLNNGILRNGEFIEVDYDEFTPYCINLSYIEDCEDDEMVMEYIDHLTGGNEEYRTLLFEVLAHTLIVDHEFKRALSKFFIFVGDGGNGKGTLLTIIRCILGTKNCSSLSIDDMTDERYLTDLKGKLANLGDDIHDKAINNEQMKVLKNITTCDYMSTRELYKQAQNVELTTSLIFTSNHILKSFEKGESYRRRVLWLPMYTEVKKKDPKFITKITSQKALLTFIKYIVQGYRRLYTQGQFTESEIVNGFNVQYHQENNNVTIFVDDLKEDEVIGRRPAEIYEEYEIWANENGYNVCSKKALGEAICVKFKCESKVRKVNGKSTRIYGLLIDTDSKT